MQARNREEGRRNALTSAGCLPIIALLPNAEVAEPADAHV